MKSEKLSDRGMELASRVEKDFLPFVIKPGRYTGNEYNAVIKNPDNVKVRVALAFPEVYELGMSYVGFDILYHILNSREHIWAERVYAPWLDAEKVLRENRIPLFSLESRAELKQFDWIGFTLQYELSYTNFLNMLDLAGIPLRTADRDESHPLIIGGGPSVHNPEPLAPFFDAILLGDGEEGVLDICRVVEEGKSSGLTREQVLQKLAQVQGIYIPSFYRAVSSSFGDFEALERLKPDIPKRIRKRVVAELKAEHYPDKPLVPLIEVTHDRFSVEIMRGCTEGCRFCNAGMIYRPLRERTVEDIVCQTQQAVRSSGFNEVSLLSLNTSDYQDLSWLMVKEKTLLSGQNVRFAFPSLRLDSITPEMVEFVQTMKKTGFTFAPEAGSQRLRNVINKNIREEDLLQTLRLLLDNGWQLVKFYFMTGLPTEKDEDVLEIAALLKKCLDISAAYRDVRFNVSISPFSPKPHTPFQWEKQDPPEELDRKIELIRSHLHHKKVNINWRDGFQTSLETSLVRGGRELAPVIETAWKKGARFDGWMEGFDREKWENAFAEHNLNWRKYLRPLSVSVPLPWDHIDMGISRHFLQKEKMRAYEGRISEDCRNSVCLGCGLQRKEFEELVDCYRDDAWNKQAAGRQSLTSANRQNEGGENGISYGRGRKIRRTPVAPVKKKIRVQFTKTGLTRFISHLDVVRVFDRAARRAGISLIYSQGFTPRPKMAFGPPLGLGIASTAEYVDLEADMGREADFQPRLNPMLPPGIQIVQQKTLFGKIPSLSAVINCWHYQTFLEEFSLPPEWIDEWMAQDSILFEREVKGEMRTVDLRPFVTAMELQDAKLQIVIESIGDRAVKVSEVLDTLMGKHEVDQRQFITQRTGQFIKENNTLLTPFEVN
ncbi:MAG: TIGR03960 family B12-binding radical SAM protein [Calditrichia bacterium]